MMRISQGVTVNKNNLAAAMSRFQDLPAVDYFYGVLGVVVLAVLALATFPSAITVANGLLI